MNETPDLRGHFELLYRKLAADYQQYSQERRDFDAAKKRADAPQMQKATCRIGDAQVKVQAALSSLVDEAHFDPPSDGPQVQICLAAIRDAATSIGESFEQCAADDKLVADQLVVIKQQARRLPGD